MKWINKYQLLEQKLKSQENEIQSLQQIVATSNKQVKKAVESRESELQSKNTKVVSELNQ